MWRILGVVCLFAMVVTWMSRERPAASPIAIRMSDDTYRRDSVLGTAYIEFRVENIMSHTIRPACRSTPSATVQHQVGREWFPQARVAGRACGSLEADVNPGESVTWHLRLAVPGRYRVQVLYAGAWSRRIAGPVFTVR